jgi:DsbC/DsbD-like thiol-disulfide interchange protein
VTGVLAFLGLAAVVFFLGQREPSGPLSELAGDWNTGVSVATRLESAQSAVGDGRVSAALHMTLESGWKTYWRVPGDSGLAPMFDWSGSKNVQSIELLWPTPRAFDELGERFYGYKGDIRWPLRVVAQDPDQPIDLSLKLDFGVCSDVCIPTSIRSSLRIPAGEAGMTGHAEGIEVAINQVPVQASEANLRGGVRLLNINGYRAELEVALFDADPMPSTIIASGLKGVYLGASHPYEENSLMVSLEANDPEKLRGKPVNLLFLYEDGRPGVEGAFLIE